MHNSDVRSDYDNCLAIAGSHYENFPVASRLLPGRLRLPIAAIYAFARSADDFADEGDRSETERLGLLDSYADRLTAIAQGNRVDAPLFIALADTIHTFKLPIALFHDLLSAFRQDVTKRRYSSFPELLDYCRRSASPIGRLLLYLNDAATDENLQLSDKVCSSLQLINFLQDMAQDYDGNDRIYLPQCEMKAFGVDESAIGNREHSPEMAALFQQQIRRARDMLVAGAPLGTRLTGRFGFEIRLIIQAGLRILEKLQDNLESPYARPRLRRHDYVVIFYRVLTDYITPSAMRSAQAEEH
jgi:squalene synthase HpnC